MWSKGREMQGSKLNRRCLVMFMAVGLVLVMAGCSLFPQEEKQLEPPLVKPAKVQLNTSKVKRGIITQEVAGTGTFESMVFADQDVEISGFRVSKMLVKSGDVVKKNDMLIQMNDNGLDLQLKKNQLALVKAEVAYKAAKTQGNSDQIYISELEVGIARMQLAEVQKEIEARKVRAQMDGVVTFVADLKTGDIVQPYAILVTIEDPTQLRLAFQAYNKDLLSGVEIGMSAQIIYDEKSYTGKVVQNSNSAPLYINLPEPPPEADIGNFADVKIVTHEKKDTLFIPRQGLRTYMGRTYVQILNGESRKEVDVEAGLESSTEVEILKGLKEDQTIILN